MNEAYQEFVAALRDGGMLNRFPHLADALWLACRLPATPPTEEVQPKPPSPPEEPQRPTQKRPDLPPDPVPLVKAASTVTAPTLCITPLRINLPGAKPEDLQVVVRDTGSAAEHPGERVPPGLDIRVPSPPSLAERDRFVRQLKLLRRLHPSVRRQELNLRATIQRFCEEQIPEPIFSPGYDRTLNLTFLIDSSATMDMWRTMACELFQVLEASGAFVHSRALVWSWTEEQGRLLPTFSSLEPVSASGKPCPATSPVEDELRFSARDVLLLFSDCTARRWYRSDCLAVLQAWASRGHLVIVNPLPTRFWARTALEGAGRIQMTMSDAGAPNACFRVDSPLGPIPPETLNNSLALPILSPEPAHLHAWARFMALRRRAFPGRLLSPRSTPVSPVPTALAPEEHQRRLAVFKRQSTPEAVELARLIAASPLVNLPIIRLLRTYLLPRIRPSANADNHGYDADVLLSGLLHIAKQVDPSQPDRAIYAFHDEANRACLLGELPRSRIQEVFDTIGFYIEGESLPPEAGRFDGFVAMLRNPEQALGNELYHVHEVVQVAASVIFRRLGGHYAELLKSQGQPSCLTDLNAALVRAEAAQRRGDIETAIRVLNDAADISTAEAWQQARPLVDELLAVYAGLLRLPGLVAGEEVEAGGEREPFVEPVTGMVLAPIAAGCFLMGSPKEETGRFEDEVQHRVTLSQDFWMGIHPVTQQQYQKIMEENRSRFQGEKRPVENVSWHDAVEFCKRLTERAAKHGILPEGYVFRLPSEAEWEYCCRAGTQTATAFGNQLSSDQANFDGNHPYGGAKKGPYLEQTSDVGSYAPNPWGLYDMHGNVWEWCRDQAKWKDNVIADTYLDGVVDPLCQVGRYRVYRGGGWHNLGRNCRSACRRALDPGLRYDRLGFRVCLNRSLAECQSGTET